ncbi:hypothetical protein PV433_25890 [Paenibacillus sp. GYB004]|uniref:hypothetical protein n=1 Tax=Paenibacillus sp. GYB004 TaxID=2994393 RepID=UPI002F96C11E
MKKFLAGTVFGAVLAFTSSTYADDIAKLVGKQIDNEYAVTLNGKALGNKAPSIEGTAYLPVREVSEKLGLKVDFDAEKGITLNSAVAKNLTGDVPEWAGKVIIYPPTEPKEPEQKELSLEEVNSLIEFYNIRLKTTNSGFIGATNGNNVEAAERLSKELEEIRTKIADLEKQKEELSK